MSLTAKQAALLTFIDGYIKKNHGVAPSFDEMTVALQLQSKSGVHRIITALEERGFIKRYPGRARAIDVIRRPGDPPPARLDPIRSALAELVATKLLKERDGDSAEYRSRRDAAWRAAFEALGLPT